MRADGLILVIPEKGDLERDAVAEAWERHGGSVLRLGRFWDPPALSPPAVRLYGNDAFCLVLEQKLSLALVSPPDDLLLGLPSACVRRGLARTSLDLALRGEFPKFAKPMTPKLFLARIYRTGAELEAECMGLPPDTEVITADVVTFTAEARCFVLAGNVLDCALYEGEGDLDEAFAAARDFAGHVQGPRTYVMDIGLIPRTGWAVVEFNASWGAGLNGCNPERVLPAIEAATAQQAGAPDEGR